MVINGKQVPLKEAVFTALALPFFIVATTLLTWGQYGAKQAVKDLWEFFRK